MNQSKKRSSNETNYTDVNNIEEQQCDSHNEDNMKKKACIPNTLIQNKESNNETEENDEPSYLYYKPDRITHLCGTQTKRDKIVTKGTYLFDNSNDLFLFEDTKPDGSCLFHSMAVGKDRGRWLRLTMAWILEHHGEFRKKFVPFVKAYHKKNDVPRNWIDRTTDKTILTCTNRLKNIKEMGECFDMIVFSCMTNIDIICYMDTHPNNNENFSIQKTSELIQEIQKYYSPSKDFQLFDFYSKMQEKSPRYIYYHCQNNPTNCLVDVYDDNDELIYNYDGTVKKTPFLQHYGKIHLLKDASKYCGNIVYFGNGKVRGLHMSDIQPIKIKQNKKRNIEQMEVQDALFKLSNKTKKNATKNLKKKRKVTEKKMFLCEDIYMKKNEKEGTNLHDKQFQFDDDLSSESDSCNSSTTTTSQICEIETTTAHHNLISTGDKDVDRVYHETYCLVETIKQNNCQEQQKEHLRGQIDIDNISVLTDTSEEQSPILQKKNNKTYNKSKKINSNIYMQNNNNNHKISKLDYPTIESSDSDETLRSSSSNTITPGQNLRNVLPSSNLCTKKFCCNCHRVPCNNIEQTYPYTMQLLIVDPSQFKRNTSRLFCNFTMSSFKNKTEATICNVCLQMMETNNNQLSGCVLWPAFIWKVLKDPKLYKKAWKLLPSQWRVWWEETTADYHNVSPDILSSIVAAFSEVTTETREDLYALKTKTWKCLLQREHSLFLPNVKCPAGCSEFKHKCNSLPMDIVWEFCLQTNLVLYSREELRACTQFFRNDYLEEDKILLNKDWLCKASYCIEKAKSQLPQVLCCRYHSTKTRTMMIHPARHPHLNIASDKSCQFAPVVPIPRTVDKARAYKYSASFQMANMEGGYKGLDTIYLNSNCMYERLNCELAWKQEIIAVSGRTDLRVHICNMIQQNRINPVLARHLLSDHKLLIPDLKKTHKECQKGASYISMDDSLKMHQSINFEGIETIEIVYTNRHEQITTTKSCAIPWPKHVAWVHPANDKHGRQFPKVDSYSKISFCCDTRPIWIITSIMVTVPDIWHLIVKSKKSTATWEGWMLVAVTKFSFTHYTMKNLKHNPFNEKKKKEEICSMFSSIDSQTLWQEFGIPKEEKNIPFVYSIWNAFSHNFKNNIEIQWNTFQIPKNEDTDVVILLMECTFRNCNSFFFPCDMITEQWQLRYIALIDDNYSEQHKWNGTVYARHGGSTHTSYWQIDRKQKYACKMPANWNVSKLKRNQIANWSVCVYVKKRQYISETIRDNLLNVCGGQTQMSCFKHNIPLISVPETNYTKCCCKTLISNQRTRKKTKQCKRNAKYICPKESCKASICRIHFYESTKNNNNKVFLKPSHKNHMYEKNIFTSIPTKKNYISSDSESETDINYIVNKQSIQKKDTQEANNITFFDSETAVKRKSMPHLNENFENEIDLIENDAWLTENIQEEAFVTDTPNANDDVMDDGLYAHQACVNTGTDDYSDVNVPTTNAGVLPIYNIVVDEPYKSNCTNNHVILNMYGSCLIRRNQKLEPTLKQQNFLQSLASTDVGVCKPLIYPEAMCFTDIFYSETKNCDIVGAIPAAFLHDATTLKQHGVSSLEDHYRTRLISPGLLSSANPKYHFFAFDCLTNIGMRGCDSRVILRRGFTECQGQGGVTFKGNTTPIFDTEQVDSRMVVNKLAAAIGESQPTYFYTHTCSMATHFGLRYIWEWIMSDGIMDIICEGHETEQRKAEIRRNVLDSAGALILRIWMEMTHIWILYITQSPDQPIGKVTKYLFRMELQDAQANVPHAHSLLWTTDDLTTKEGLNAAMDRIRAIIDDILRPDEKDIMIDEGIFSNHHDICCFLDMIEPMLKHTHQRRCFYTKKNDVTGEDETMLRCKVTNNWAVNPNKGCHTFQHVDVNHSQEAIKIMQEVGVAQKPSMPPKEVERLDFIPLLSCLQNIKHVPPAHGNEGLISPVSGMLMARNPNTDNLQFTTGYLLSRYLAKYILSVDLNNVITIKPPVETEENNNIYQVSGKQILNTKITGNKILNDKQQQETNDKVQRQRQARAINVAEIYMHMFQYDPVMTNIKFEYIPTQPYEERAGVERKSSRLDAIIKKYEHLRNDLQRNALTAIKTIPSYHAHSRLPNVPTWRNFLPTQLKKAEDELASKIDTDRVTKFGLRPPELRFVMNLPKYFRWFELTPIKGDLKDQIEYCGKHIVSNYTICTWIDGLANHVKVRVLAIPEIILYIQQLDLSHLNTDLQAAHSQKICALGHFKFLNDAYQYLYKNQTPTSLLRHAQPDQILTKYYICRKRFLTGQDDAYLPVPWFRYPRPTNTNRFLIHILLSMGKYVDEYDLFSCASLRDSFVKAKLINEDDPLLSAKNLMKTFITEQLTSLPAGTMTWDKYCVSAYTAFVGIAMNNSMVSDDLPSVLYTKVQKTTQETIERYIQKKRNHLISHLLSKLNENNLKTLPTKQQCISATVTNPVKWHLFYIKKAPNQPDESYHEQQALLKIGSDLIQHYLLGLNECTKNLCIVGAGGVGKTTVSLCLLLFCVTRGLLVGTAAMCSERSQELAGDHINNLWLIPSNNTLTTGQLAERAITRLYRCPERMQYLRSLDVLLIDEFGVIPAHILSVIDIIMRYIRSSNKPFGGILIIATLDNLQLDPVKGRHPLLSPLLTTSFIFEKLCKSVRAASDANWQRIQEITRLPFDELQQPHIKEEFFTLVTTHCTFVPNTSHRLYPSNPFHVYGKREPTLQEEKKKFEDMQATETEPYLISVAHDFERSIEGRYVPASKSTSNYLNRKLKEPQKLFFYKHGRYQITYNNTVQEFSNSQLAVLTRLPTLEQVEKKEAIQLLVAPPGCRYIPGEGDTEQELQDSGWTYKKIGIGNNSVQNIGSGIRAKREQYGLRHHIGSTFHSVMGQTMACIVTKVDDRKQSPYHIWLASQVVVLLSRTRFAKDTYFLSNNKMKTAETLYNTLTKTTPFRAYISYLLECLCSKKKNTDIQKMLCIDQSRSIYRPRDVPIPNDNTGQVYILVSTRDNSFVYIGSTFNLSFRFKQHNSGCGAEQTSSISLRPWALLAYVCGFNGNENKFRLFENKWIEAKQRLLSDKTRQASVEAIVRLAKEIIVQYQQTNDELKLIECGTFQRIKEILSKDQNTC